MYIQHFYDQLDSHYKKNLKNYFVKHNIARKEEEIKKTKNTRCPTNRIKVQKTGSNII